jgi:hypothetical protein
MSRLVYYPAIAATLVLDAALDVLLRFQMAHARRRLRP